MSGTPDGSVEIDAAPPGLVPAAITIRVFALFSGHRGPTANATLVAFQDGDGPWTALVGSGGVYEATTTSERYAIAVGCAGDRAGVDFYYQSVGDTTEVNADGCPGPDDVRVSISLHGLQDGELGEVWLGSIIATRPKALADAFDVDVPRGMVDVFVRAKLSNAQPTKVFRGPRVDFQANQSLILDLDTMGLLPQARTLSLSHRDPAESVFVNASHTTPFSLVPWSVWSRNFGTTDPDSYLTLPDAALQPDDVSNVTVQATRTTEDGRTLLRAARLAMKSPGSVILDLPGIPYAPEPPAVDKATVPRATVTIPIVPDALKTISYFASLFTADAGPTTGTSHTHAYTFYVRSGWAGMQSSATIVTPDLSSLPGWTPDMALLSGAPVAWSILRNDSNLPYDTQAVDGRRLAQLGASGTLTP